MFVKFVEAFLTGEEADVVASALETATVGVDEVDFAAHGCGGAGQGRIQGSAVLLLWSESR